MPQEKVPRLSEPQRKAIAETIKSWANVHPHPDKPVILLLDGSELTPRDMAQAAVEADTKRGRLLYRAFAAGLIADEVEAPETLDEILSDYRRDASLWASGRSR